MFDISWNELLVIAAVALVVIGPKDLPKVLRQLTQWIKKARELAADFQRNVDEMMREAELADLKTQIEKATSGAVEDVQKTVDPGGEMQKAFEAPDTFTQPPPALSSIGAPPIEQSPGAFPADAAAGEPVPLASPSQPVEMAPPTPKPSIEPHPAVAASEPPPPPVSEPLPPQKAAS